MTPTISIARPGSLFFVAVSLAASVLMPMTVPGDTHINTRALGTNQNDRLYFYNGPFFDTNSGYKMAQVLRTNGLNAGYHRGDVLTFTVDSAEDLNPATGQGTGQVLGRAVFGSRIAVQLVGVDGPPGGVFSFWEGDGENPGLEETFSVPVGATNGTNWFLVSENTGAPRSDPYGHIHGRTFTTTVPGRYTAQFRAIDVSTNGAGGGPFHAPSDVFSMYFQAGPSIDGILKLTNGFRVTFRSAPGVTNVLESTDALGSGVWKTVAGPLRGTSALQSLTDTNAPASARSYRLRLLNIPP